MSGDEDDKDTLRSALGDACDFVGGLVADGKGTDRDKVAKGFKVAGRVARTLPSPDEAAEAWKASPLGRLERQLRKHGIVRDRVANTDHLKRGKGDDDK